MSEKEQLLKMVDRLYRQYSAKIARVKQMTLDEWDSSLCKICSVPKKIDMNPFGFYVVCSGWSGPPAQPDEGEPFRCMSFKEKEDKT